MKRRHPPVSTTSIDRRHFLQTAAVSGLAVLGSTGRSGAEASDSGLSGIRRCAAQLMPDGDRAAPASRPQPFGWRAVALPPAGEGELGVFRWPGGDTPVGRPGRIRFTLAASERGDTKVQIRLAKSSRVLAELDLLNHGIYMPIEASLSAEQVADVVREGVRLEQRDGATALWFFASAQTDQGRAPAFEPHLLFDDGADPLQEFYRRMASLETLERAGWHSGCVWDGLWALHETHPECPFRQALDRQMPVYFTKDRPLFRIGSIETPLPYAVLAKMEPDHPALDVPLEFWESRRRPSGSIQDGEMMSAEACYTTAYPMAVIGKTRQDEALVRDALDQVRHRADKLWDGKDLHLRYFDNGRRVFRCWARGIAWHFLGLTRTMLAAGERDDVDDLKREAKRIADWIVPYQREDGLWCCFVDEPEVKPDTSGSAGIAAALALGARQDWLGTDALQAARLADQGLRAHLTPDGFLDGVSTGNRSAEFRLQRGPHRVISPMGMGLYAQLLAALA